MHHEQMAQAVPGDNVGFNVGGIAKNDIKRGDVAGPVDNPPTVAKEFTAQIIVLNHPSVITVGYTPVFHIHTAQVACQITEIVSAQRAGKKLEDLSFIKNGDNAIVKVRPSKPLVIESAKDFPPLGRFAIRDMGQTVAAGVCIEVNEKA
jgi:elongation factor 1-alpha